MLFTFLLLTQVTPWCHCPNRGELCGYQSHSSTVFYKRNQFYLHDGLSI